MAEPIAVVALGGNALLPPGARMDPAHQRQAVARTAEVLASLASSHRLVVVHGNGPQVGYLALQGEALAATDPDAGPGSLDELDAQSEGMIGYVVEQELGNRLPGRTVATLLTQVVVDRDDPAFARPTKPIGPRYPRAEAERLAAERGWTVAPAGLGWRRVVPSPDPISVVELAVIELLVEHGVVVVCGGGGGIPVTERPDGTRRGVEAVIDKDLTAALLATALDAAALLLLTDVDAVMDGWGGPEPSPVRWASAAELRARAFDAGSMAPKVEAACRFAEATGHPARIGALTAAAELLAGSGGTTVTAR